MSKKDKPFQPLGINALLGEPLADERSKITLPTERISLPDSQPRHYFDADKMAQLVASVRLHGILQPLLVRPQGNDYELVAGERRYRAALAVGLPEVPVVIRDLTDEAARQLALIENLHREDLNPVEEVEGILQLLSLTLKASVAEAISALHYLKNKKEGKVMDNAIRNEAEPQILDVFDKLGQNWYSFVCNRLPLVNLPEDLLAALREGKIAYTKAKALAAVKETEYRQALLEEAIAQSLSLSAIRQRIKQLKQDSQKSDAQALKVRLKTTLRQVEQQWESLESEQKKQLEDLLVQMQQLLTY